MRVPSDLPRRRSFRAGRVSKRSRNVLIGLVAVAIVLFLSARGIAGFYTDVLWFDSLGRSDVYWSILRTKILLGTVFFAIAAVMLFVNMVIADRLAPTDIAPGPDEQFIIRYRSIAARRSRVIRLGFSAFFALIAGAPISGHWQDWLLFRHGVNFGIKDALFGRDVGFYIFSLPFLSFLVDWFFAIVVICFLVSAVVHYLNGGIRLPVDGRRVTPQVKLHLSALLALLALLKAAGYYLQRLKLTTSTRGFVDGAGYTDVNAQRPAIELLIAISLLAAVFLLWNVRQRGWRLPVIAVGLWALVATVAGAAFPAIYQQAFVKSSESTKESPYIQRNLEATRQAMGIDTVEEASYPVTDVKPTDVSSNSESLSNVRLLDPTVMLDTVKNRQGQQRYYQFNQLDLDRYQVNGKDTQALVAVRELYSDGADPGWVNRHLIFTHGSGMAIAPVAQIQQQGVEGRPNFLSTETLGLTEPSVYYGEALGGGYVVTNTSQKEIGPEGTKVSNDYSGNGVKVGGRLRRVAFALRFNEWNLFVSPDLNSSSKMLYVRDISDRVSKLAPFLRFDSDPYPVISNGRVTWVIDAYTTSDKYPYAQRADTGRMRATGLGQEFNYVRNSVKAVVDGYDGSVHFYATDPSDPILRAYSSAFPKLFEEASGIPADLAAHFRYPQDLFRAQTNVWERYRLKTPSEFYSPREPWQVSPAVPQKQAADVATRAATTTSANTATTVSSLRSDLRSKQDGFAPSYQLVKLPGGTSLEYVLMRPFVPKQDQDSQRKELKGFMAASLDTNGRPRLRVYDVTGTTSPPGPANVDASVKSTFATDLSLLDQAGSAVSFGDPQLVPLPSGVVWVRPVYVETNRQPTLRQVAVLSGQSPKWASSLDGALQQLFPGVNPGFSSIVGGVVAPPDTTTPTPPSTPAPAGGATIDSLLAEARAANTAAKAAYDQGDLTEWKRQLEKANSLFEQAATLATTPAGGSTTTSPTAGSTTSTRPATSTTTASTTAPATTAPTTTSASEPVSSTTVKA